MNKCREVHSADICGWTDHLSVYTHPKDDAFGQRILPSAAITVTYKVSWVYVLSWIHLLQRSLKWGNVVQGGSSTFLWKITVGTNLLVKNMTCFFQFWTGFASAFTSSALTKQKNPGPCFQSLSHSTRNISVQRNILSVLFQSVCALLMRIQPSGYNVYLTKDYSRSNGAIFFRCPWEEIFMGKTGTREIAPGTPWDSWLCLCWAPW